MIEEQGEGDFEFTLSFVSLSDDNTTILLNGESDYAVVLPDDISIKNAASKMDIIQKLILEGCSKYKGDYVSEDTLRNCAKEIVSQFYERARQLKILDSVSDVIRMNQGRVMLTKAKIIGVSPPYKMITEAILECPNCKETWIYDFKEKPQVSYTQTKKYCPNCSSKKGGHDRYDLHAHLEHTDAKTITIQDIDLRDDLEKLYVILLGDQTRRVRVGETASITGDVDVLNPTGAGGKKPTTIMYAANIKYEREEERKGVKDPIFTEW